MFSHSDYRLYKPPEDQEGGSGSESARCTMLSCSWLLLLMPGNRQKTRTVLVLMLLKAMQANRSISWRFLGKLYALRHARCLADCNVSSLDSVLQKLLSIEGLLQHLVSRIAPATNPSLVTESVRLEQHRKLCERHQSMPPCCASAFGMLGFLLTPPPCSLAALYEDPTQAAIARRLACKAWSACVQNDLKVSSCEIK